ncbi:MAG: GGDEF domain-containing protein, partial [Nitrospirota bacterium]|nr:GGDEF domain-containing protein [Nitrospirota bacterium]
CWEIKGCKSKKCPAYKSKNYRCWLQVGTICGGEVQGEFSKKYNTCFDCEVFKVISEQPVRALYENINTIVFHLNNKAARLRELSIIDHLTGMYNRHFFNEVIEREFARLKKNGEAVSFIMIDMDHLKHINDTLGHLTGDKILAECAILIRNSVRKSDLVFRFGGDEFLVLMMNTSCRKSARVIRRLREATVRWNDDNAAKFGCGISFSIGCSTSDDANNLFATLNEADAKMYRNKKEKNKK